MTQLSENAKLVLTFGRLLGRDDDEIVGQAIIGAMEVRDAVSARLTDDEVFLIVLQEFGRECPHPAHRQKIRNADDISRWWREGCVGPQPKAQKECGVCGSVSIPIR